MISGMVLSDSSSCAPGAQDDWGDDQGMIFKVSNSKDGDDWGTILKVSGSKSGEGDEEEVRPGVSVTESVRKTFQETST